MKHYDFYLYDIYDIDTQCYYTPEKRQEFTKNHSIKHVPILYNNYVITETVEINDLLKFAEGPSMLNKDTEREGLVFKNVVLGRCSFKAISNKYLLKQH
jgi:ATP-dependent RNA circularization protein (DNA/RNA ligase family)